MLLLYLPAFYYDCHIQTANARQRAHHVRAIDISLLIIRSSYILSDVCRCNLEDILLEMDRILQPEGAVIFQDEVDVLIKVKKITTGMRWGTKMVDHEDDPLVPKKILVAVKQYWVVGGNSTAAE
ncbi:hypothetical protein HRI_002718800 [Hibiscus trionum]|uniref:Methyltransferase n=1 Tax=Hibiscus trionum TaxID=183268 RepID=A0A9W7I5U1_HIBTR|nr:hypothetical protein HRI_002718800 [Hibiscus trionum]